jgi:spermidine synthase
VIRLSKKYLPGMAISYQHPKVKTHIGDGFKFLDDYKNEFDVIITDSSDPEGPAESLFQKPYFELLFGALKEGGVITTQGCTLSFVKKSDNFTLYFSISSVLSIIFVTA